MSPGSFDTRVSIQLAPTVSRSAVSNEVISTPGSTITVWASRESDVSGSSTQEGDIGPVYAQQKDVYYTIRYITGIGAQCILSDAFGTYNITAVDPVDRRKYLKLRCELITQDNV